MNSFKMSIGLFVALLSLGANASEFLVKYKDSRLMNTLSSSANMQVLEQNTTAQLFKVEIAKAKQANTLAQLLANPQVEYVVPNAEVHMFRAPLNATALKEQWAIAKVNAEMAWKKAGNKGSKKVVVAVIDTGVDYKHKNLMPNMIQGYDFINNNNDPNDITSGNNPGHGTHCAGIVGASGLVEGGTIGLSPEVSIMPLRFLDQNGSGDLNNGIKAIDYAIEKKVDIISASWGAAISRAQAKPLIEAIERAEKAGIVFVVAAANDGKNNDSYEVYPANAGTANSIAVAASGSADAKPSWSNYGKATVHLASPGEAIMSTLPKDKYGNLSGTSMATPLVAGLVALVKAQDPTLTPVQIRALLQSTGAKVAIQTACDCRVDALSAVDTIMAKKMFVAPFAATLKMGDKMMFSAVYGEAPFTFTSSDMKVATIDDKGELTAVADGETQVAVKDNKGATATSYKIYVGKKGSDNPDEPAPGDCPLGDQKLCDIICQIMPDLPFCSK